MCFVLEMEFREKGEQGGVRRTAQDPRQNVIGERFEAVSRGFLDLGIRVVRQYEEHRRELDRLEGQSATGGHPARLDRRVAACIFFGLGREPKRDLLGGRPGTGVFS